MPELLLMYGLLIQHACALTFAASSWWWDAWEPAMGVGRG